MTPQTATPLAASGVPIITTNATESMRPSQVNRGTRVQQVSYLDEIDDDVVLKALEKLRSKDFRTVVAPPNHHHQHHQRTRHTKAQQQHHHPTNMTTPTSSSSRNSINININSATRTKGSSCNDSHKTASTTATAASATTTLQDDDGHDDHATPIYSPRLSMQDDEGNGGGGVWNWNQVGTKLIGHFNCQTFNGVGKKNGELSSSPKDYEAKFVYNNNNKKSRGHSSSSSSGTRGRKKDPPSSSSNTVKAIPTDEETAAAPTAAASSSSSSPLGLVGLGHEKLRQLIQFKQVLVNASLQNTNADLLSEDMSRTAAAAAAADGTDGDSVTDGSLYLANEELREAVARAHRDGPLTPQKRLELLKLRLKVVSKKVMTNVEDFVFGPDEPSLCEEDGHPTWDEGDDDVMTLGTGSLADRSFDGTLDTYGTRSTYDTYGTYSTRRTDDNGNDDDDDGDDVEEDDHEDKANTTTDRGNWKPPMTPPRRATARAPTKPVKPPALVRKTNNRTTPGNKLFASPPPMTMSAAPSVNGSVAKSAKASKSGFIATSPPRAPKSKTVMVVKTSSRTVSGLALAGSPPRPNARGNRNNSSALSTASPANILVKPTRTSSHRSAGRASVGGSSHTGSFSSGSRVVIVANDVNVPIPDSLLYQPVNGDRLTFAAATEASDDMMAEEGLERILSLGSGDDHGVQTSVPTTLKIVGYADAHDDCSILSDTSPKPAPEVLRNKSQTKSKIRSSKTKNSKTKLSKTRKQRV